MVHANEPRLVVVPEKVMELGYSNRGICLFLNKDFDCRVDVLRRSQWRRALQEDDDVCCSAFLVH